MSLSKKFNKPLVGHTIYVKIVGHWIGVYTICKVASAHLVDEICGTFFIACTPLAFGQRIIYFGKTIDWHVRIPKQVVIIVCWKRRLHETYT